jgi:hypothetical protein
MKAGPPTVLLLLLLAACSPDVRSLELADVDLSDMGVVQEIRQNLPPEDRPVFSTYIVRHLATSSSFCGETLVDRNGREPRTIGEALVLTVMREERDRRERLAAKRPLSAPELARRERDLLIGQREALLARQTYLFSTQGPGVQQLPEWDAITAQIAEIDGKLKARASAPAPGAR